MSLSMTEKTALRQLAEKYMKYATLPIQNEKIILWKSINAGTMQRPMVCMDQLPISELLCDDITCVVTDPFWRDVEWNLRIKLYMWERFPVDMVLEPYISLPKAITNTGYGVSADRESLGEQGTSAMSQHFTPVIETIEDVSKITDKVISFDEKLNEIHRQEACELFENVAPFVMRNHPGNHMDYGFYLGLWDILSELIGIEESYVGLLTDPDLIHAAMNRLTESTIACINQANELGFHDDITNRCHCSYTYNDILLPESGMGKGPYSQNSWAFGLAQIFTAISPAMFEEFEFPYIKRLAEHFGMVYYGCCDRMDDRLDIIKRISNVRKISCSPWSDRKNFAENIGTDIVMSNKPSPAFLAAHTLDEAAIRADLQLSCDLAKSNGCNLEFILKDVSTVYGNPQHLVKWAEIAMDVVQNY